MAKPIYLDHNATTPLAPQVLSAMLPYLKTHFGNPSSSHAPGRAARKAVDEAREDVARLLGCAPNEIVFTSGGSEANSLAILGAAKARAGRGHVITAATEHPAVLTAVQELARWGYRTTVLPVDSGGRVSPGDLERAITAETFLVSIMLANNETGIQQPIAELARVAKARGVLFHTDAVQAVGKVPVRVGQLGVDMLSLAGHKFYGPKGVGALYVKKDVKLTRLLAGGHQERDLRPGTENVAGMVGLAAAAKLAHETLDAEGERVRALREELFAHLAKAVPDVLRNSPVDGCLPNTLHVSFPGADGEGLTVALDLAGVHVSAGAACHTGAREPSHVLAAMGIPDARALCSLRLTLGRSSTSAQMKTAAAAIAKCAARSKAVRDGR